MPCPRSNCSQENCANLADGSPDIVPNWRFGVPLCYVSGPKPKDVYRDPREAIRKAADDLEEKRKAKASRKAARKRKAEQAEGLGGVEDGDMGGAGTRLRKVRATTPPRKKP